MFVGHSRLRGKKGDEERTMRQKRWWHSGEIMQKKWLYVDDIIFTGSTLVIRSLFSRFSSQCSINDLGDIHYFLGVFTGASSNGGDYAYE